MELLTTLCNIMLSVNKYLLIIIITIKKQQKCVVFFPKVNMTESCERPRAACLLR